MKVVNYRIVFLSDECGPDKKFYWTYESRIISNHIAKITLNLNSPVRGRFSDINCSYGGACRAKFTQRLTMGIERKPVKERTANESNGSWLCNLAFFRCYQWIKRPNVTLFRGSLPLKTLFWKVCKLACCYATRLYLDGPRHISQRK